MFPNDFWIFQYVISCNVNNVYPSSRTSITLLETISRKIILGLCQAFSDDSPFLHGMTNIQIVEQFVLDILVVNWDDFYAWSIRQSSTIK